VEGLVPTRDPPDVEVGGDAALGGVCAKAWRHGERM